jgi:hypothetical protein
MNVHRKRSQLAVLDQSSTQLLNRSLSNDPAELVTVRGCTVRLVSRRMCRIDYQNRSAGQC